MTTYKTSRGTLLSTCSDEYETEKLCIFHLYRPSETLQSPEVKQIIEQCAAVWKRQKAREGQTAGAIIQVWKYDRAAIFAHCFLTYNLQFTMEIGI